MGRKARAVHPWARRSRMKSRDLSWKRVACTLLATAALGAGIGSALAQPKPAPEANKYPMDRTVLPIAEPKYPLAGELDARKAKPPARFEVKAPKGAPNV